MAFQENLNASTVYTCFRFSEVMYQMFLTVRVPCRVLSGLRLV